MSCSAIALPPWTCRMSRTWREQMAQLRHGHFRHAEGSAGPGRLGVCMCVSERQTATLGGRGGVRPGCRSRHDPLKSGSPSAHSARVGRATASCASRPPSTRPAPANISAAARSIGVSTDPGHSELIRMPYGASSTATARTNALRAPLLAAALAYPSSSFAAPRIPLAWPILL